MAHENDNNLENKAVTETDTSEQLDEQSTNEEPTTSTSEHTKKPKRSIKLRNPFSVFKPISIKNNIKNKRIFPLTLYISILGLITVFAIPTTRYSILGLVIKKSFSISVIDKETKKPVSEASVSIDGQTAKTNKEGLASFSELKVGSKTATIAKSNYSNTSSSVFVSLLEQKDIPSVEFEATGRQVNVQIIDFITKKPVSNTFLRYDDFEARSDENGFATLIAPVGKETLEATIALDNYNERAIAVTVSEDSDVNPANIFTITPKGSIYYLSKLTGNIDVVSSNLDGSNRKTILESTGFETESGTVLIASRDWKHIAVKSTRNANGNETVSYINTTDNSIKVADEGDATFQIVGWYDDRLIYVVNRNVSNEAERYKLKSYNPADGKIALLEISDFKSLGNSCAYGYCSDKYEEETITKVAIVEGGIIYAVEQYGGEGPTATIYKIKANGQDKVEVAKIALGDYLQQFYAWNPLEIYYNYYDNESDKYKYFELAYTDAEPKEITDPIEINSFDTGSYNAYLLSPDSEQSFWSESRDGKNVFFTGSKIGENPQELGRLSEFAAYGWFTDNYLLLTKNSSEMFIMPVEGGEPAKITDYHKPENGYRPYGYGYGG